MILSRIHARLSFSYPSSVFIIFIFASRIHAHIKLCFLYACIDMDSYDVVYLSSDDESPFDRNQRILREYHEEEDRRLVQSHLSRVLQEVIEGKRKTLRIAALPEPSSIPIATP